jgi:ketosteroid isomerase-like protein
MERSHALERFVVDWFQAASRGDASMVDTHVSLDDGVRLIGSDPEEHLRGGSIVADFLRGEVRGAGGEASFTPTDIDAFSEGTVGWATTIVTIELPDGKQVSPRWSSVFHLEGGVWKIVHTHASIGVPNQEIGWTYPD